MNVRAYALNFNLHHYNSGLVLTPTPDHICQPPGCEALLSIVAMAMSGIRRANLFVPSVETYNRSAVATIGVLKDTFGYWTHGLQGSICVSLL